MFKSIHLLLALGLGLAAVTTVSGQNAPRAEPVVQSSTGLVEPSAPHSANYQISPGDVVAIKVFREPDLDSQQRISKDGTINFPLLGVVKLAGKTTNEAAAHLAGLLDKDYVHHPQVSVSISTYNKVHFTVLGQVTTPGTYDIPDEQAIDLLSAIARAGGFTRLAQPKKVTVRRLINGQEDAFTVDVERMMRDNQVGRFIIQPNDTISVPERFF